jgi:hypothetical protein
MGLCGCGLGNKTGKELTDVDAEEEGDAENVLEVGEGDGDGEDDDEGVWNVVEVMSGLARRNSRGGVSLS